MLSWEEQIKKQDYESGLQVGRERADELRSGDPISNLGASLAHSISDLVRSEAELAGIEDGKKAREGEL